MLRLIARVVLAAVASAPAGAADALSSIPTNRTLEMLTARKGATGQRRMFRQAGELLGDWKIFFTNVMIDGTTLKGIAEARPGEPFVRVVREELCRPVDVEDFLYFLDDVLLAGKRGLRGQLVWVLPGRARSAGILVHPQDVFRRNRPRRYGEDRKPLAIDKPRPQPELAPAADGDPPGPGWTARYRNPLGDEAKMEALRKKQASPTFADRVDSLLNQLRDQGCEVGLYTTVRNRERGYLMYGSFLLSHVTTRRGMHRAIRLLKRLNRAWKLEVPIQWQHPDGWRATVEAARQMRDAYPVTYASRSGAKKSRHYDGKAVDFTAVNLPRLLTLTAPNGAIRTFDLSAPYQTRDVNLTPEVIRWMERNFRLKKLKMDYPHWNDEDSD